MTDEKYCHSCGVSLGHFTLSLPTTFTGTRYGYEHYTKHITVPSAGGLISVYDDPDYQTYHDGIIDTTASGFVHVDAVGTTFVFYVGHRIGVTYSGGVFLAEDNSRKVVCPHRPGKIHSYSVPSGIYSPTDKCDKCGGPLFDYKP